MKVVLLLLAVLLCVVSSARGFSLTQHVDFFRRKLEKNAGGEERMKREQRRESGATTIPSALWFDKQQVDHFDPSNDETWSQRYFLNQTFYDATNPLVFLCVGGEGPAFQPTVVVTGGVHCAWMIHLAEKFGALIVAVEHRFYGESMPKPDFSVDSLRYLSSRQAQEDIKGFRAFVTEQYDLPETSKWITFGGSYPGMMASWARLLYPDSFYGSISSSAPVEAQLNFQGYNDVVAFSMNDTTVGGSPQCLFNIRTAFGSLGKVIAEGHQGDLLNLAKTFGVCDPNDILDGKNQKMFLEGFWGLFPLQSNDPSCQGEYCNYEKICDLFTDNQAPENNLLTLFQHGYGDEDCYDIKWSSMLDDLKNESSQDRSWIWQTCTEFGFYQTCDPDTNCPFTTYPWLSTVQSYLDICEDVFGVDAQTTTQDISLSNVFYGGWNYNGTNVFFVNGDVDPWHASSVLTPNDALQQTLMVKGASHHAWTHPSKPTDQASVVAARLTIESLVDEWVTGREGDTPRSS